MTAMRTALFIIALTFLQACGPDRPENATVADFGCFEIQHVAAHYSGGAAHFSEIIVRGDATDDCPRLARITFDLFADANGNGQLDANESLLAGDQQYAEFTTSARIYPTSHKVERGSGPLWYRVMLTDSEGTEHVSLGACPE